MNNEKHIRGFLRELKANGRSDGTRKKYSETLGQFSRALDNKDFMSWEKKDVVEALIWLEEHGYKESVVSKKKAHLKKFFQTLYECEGREYPKLVSWFTVGSGGGDRFTYEDMITQEELFNALDDISSARVRAIFALEWDIGSRPHETLKLLIRYIKRDRHGYRVYIPEATKTGFRMVRGTISVPFVTQYLEGHPFRKEPNHPFIIRERGEKKALAYDGLRKVHRTYKKFFPKRLHSIFCPYLFRHSSATFYGGFLTEAQLCSRLGWKQGSKMAGKYVHMSGRDTEDTILGHFGLKAPGDDKSVEVVKRCMACQEVNPGKALFCWKCQRPLDAEALLKGDEAIVEKVKKEIVEYLKQELNP